jgi:uncharacterized protein (DUF305 family)
MKRHVPRSLPALLALVALGTGSLAAQARSASAAQADSLRNHYTVADVEFLNGMIGHHAQAVLIAGWVPTHGGGLPVQRMAERIVVGQQDEIHLMQQWLKDQGLTPADPSAHQHAMPEMDHAAMMPGMLSPAQLAQLDSARGPAFDRLFLTFMIMHHQGAVTMVDKLFATPGAAQVETVFRLASDVYADQTTEIDRMQKMLAALPSPRTDP